MEISRLDSLFPTSINNAEDMIAMGKKIASLLQKGDVVALIGDLGAGKTHLAKGIAAFFGYTGNVSSPTFSLIHEYTPTPLVHLDLYRMEQPQELLAIGWDDYLESNRILLVEWADRFSELMPENTHWILSEHQDSGRFLQYARH